MRVSAAFAVWFCSAILVLLREMWIIFHPILRFPKAWLADTDVPGGVVA